MAGGSEPQRNLAHAAGAAVLSGIAWSLFKSSTASTSSASSSASRNHLSSLQIAKGDTLFSISQRYGVSVDSLRAANGINGDTIYAGEALVIPK